MSALLGDIGTGLLCGFLFGFVLENAGFGSPCKLTAQFRLTDWSVFKVMFTAIVVTAVGLYVLKLAGLVEGDGIFIPPAFLWAAAAGGALVGAGFAVGGYCPGTSMVGMVSGRLDALVFLGGLLIGTWLFAGAYGWLEALTVAGEFGGGDTLPQALNLPEWLVNLFMIAAAVAVFWIGGRFERRAGGAVTAEQAIEGAGYDKK